MRSARETVKDLIRMKHVLESINLAMATADFKHGEESLDDLIAAAQRIQKDFKTTRLAVEKLKKEKK